MIRRKISLLILLMLSISPGSTRAAGETRVYLPMIQNSAGPGGIATPQLKWQRGGCYASWCETGWYSSPAVVDLDGDGRNEVIASAYSIVALDGNTGELIWRVASGHDRSQPGADNSGRTWPGIVVADVDHDQQMEIVTAHGGGHVSVYDLNGYFAPGWPQLGDDSGYAYGIFNDNAAVGDLDGDGFGELVVPSDVHYICTYERDGSQVPANAMYGGKDWGKVGVWESLAVEQRGWGTCAPGVLHGPHPI